MEVQAGVRPSRRIAVLFTRTGSIYHQHPLCEPYDKIVDARSWMRGSPVIAHPPCRAWGRLKGFSNHTEAEKLLGLWAVNRVRENGGVLEHPAHSSLWVAAGLPSLTGRDAWGGFTLEVCQWWWGHRAEKRTWLYFAGIEPEDLPPIPAPPPGRPTHIIGCQPGLRRGDPRWRPEVTKREREETPPDLAEWLIQVALRSKRPKQPIPDADLEEGLP